MSGFGKPVKTPTGVGELVLTETGDLLFTASADEVDVQDGCCPFCHSSKKKQKTMPRLVETKGEEQRSLAHTPWIEFESPEEAVDAQRCIQQANCWTGQSSPRHLLVLLNPASGKGRSKAIWESVKKYICGAAGLRCSVVESEGPNHFIELVSSMDMVQVHGIVIIGGDGTAYEVLQGMLGRADWASMVKIPLAQIPSGSGNALCASLRISDPMHAAFVAIKGCCHPMDAATVLQEPNKRTFSFLTLTTGLLANLDYGTNHLRWMGELRFTLGAIYEILAKRTSTVRVRYLPKDAVQSDRKASVDWELSTPGEDRLGHCDPSYGPTCPVLRSLPDLDFENLGASLSNTSFPEEWKELGSSHVQLFVAANIPWISTSYNLAPPARINDGAYTLMWTTEATRLQGIDFLLKSEKGEHLGLPFLHHEKVAALLFEPISRNSWELVDGELVPLGTTYVEVHPGLLNVMVDPQTLKGFHAPEASTDSLLV